MTPGTHIPAPREPAPDSWWNEAKTICSLAQSFFRLWFLYVFYPPSPYGALWLPTFFFCVFAS